MSASIPSLRPILPLLAGALLLCGAAQAQEAPGLPGDPPPPPAAATIPAESPAPGIEAGPADPAATPTDAPTEVPMDAGPDAPVALPGLRAGQPPEPAQRTMDDMGVAVLQGLDKITARTSTFEVPVGGTGRFGQLNVTVRACREAPPIETPESAAFLEIDERRPEDPGPTRQFSGWMFASSPALSAMEHAVYDVWVIDCKSPSTSSASAPSP